MATIPNIHISTFIVKYSRRLGSSNKANFIVKAGKLYNFIQKFKTYIHKLSYYNEYKSYFSSMM